MNTTHMELTKAVNQIAEGLNTTFDGIHAAILATANNDTLCDVTALANYHLGVVLEIANLLDAAVEGDPQAEIDAKSLLTNGEV